ncbi:hypothetical protein Syun_031787 [Stephania yunnanensis]|uniref:Uncharacterized protein n=1 Tax=Stephania yunnanensis TaxID=152371 RepID=A0AAP0HEQ7_9MAGN
MICKLTKEPTLSKKSLDRNFRRGIDLISRYRRGEFCSLPNNLPGKVSASSNPSMQRLISAWNGGNNTFRLGHL